MIAAAPDGQAGLSLGAKDALLQGIAARQVAGCCRGAEVVEFPRRDFGVFAYVQRVARVFVDDGVRVFGGACQCLGRLEQIEPRPGRRRSPIGELGRQFGVPIGVGRGDVAVVDLETGFIAQIRQGLEVLAEGIFATFSRGPFHHERGVAIAIVPSLAGVIDQQVINAH